jgi:hypothetical protein
MFVVTGNTFNTGGNWMGGEAIIRLYADWNQPAKQTEWTEKLSAPGQTQGQTHQ